MPFIDLTREITAEAAGVKTQDVPLKSAATCYTGVVYRFAHDSMQGTYIDFPGHIRETDDGRTAADIPLEQLCRVPASVIHLARTNNSGAVTAAELEQAFGGVPSTPALVINALGERNSDGIDQRTVYLDSGAVAWIIGSGCKLLVSDIYESLSLDGVFLKLFAAGVSTVCEPANLWKLPARTHLTVLFPRIQGVTQLPCRIIAELDGTDLS